MTYPTIFKQQRIFHGCDYNPEQWLNYPEILKKDLEMMKESHCNIMSVGIFSWAKLEPEEGKYDFSWLDKVLDDLNAAGVKGLLATPTAARPAWMSHKYPEVLRVYEDGHRILHCLRHNHCSSSEVYREKTRLINTELAKRYAHHPAVIGWHIGNEFGGYCYCDKCQANFRKWLQKKYGTLDKLNEAWWTTFWSHTYTDWSQIEAPSRQYGETCVHGLTLDWRRFNTDLVTDFIKKEIEAVKAFNPDLPCTTNFMEFFYDYDYFEVAKVLDFVCWDSYPEWHIYPDPELVASYTAMNHDLMRGYHHGKPWVLMESCPSATNWREISKLKKPGMHTLASLQAVAHGADNVQYFQWRKSRGSSEKFHGAVIDHVGTLDTRVGREVKSLGEILEKLGPVAGAETRAGVALVFDTQNRWAVEDAQGPRNLDKKFIEPGCCMGPTSLNKRYLRECHEIYREFWRRGIAVDLIDETCPLDNYKLVLAPMTYMVRDGFAQRVEKFVRDGGTYVSTYWSGIVNETDLCFLGGFPGPLKDVLGIWDEEIEALPDVGEYSAPKGQTLGRGYDGTELVKVTPDLCPELEGSYEVYNLCGLIHPTTAKTLAVYDSDFFKGMSAVTVNNFGKGKAYYLATRFGQDFLSAFTDKLANELSLDRALEKPVKGVSAAERFTDTERYLFVGNYADNEASVTLKGDYEDAVSGDKVSGTVTLPACGVRVLKAKL